MIRQPLHLDAIALTKLAAEMLPTGDIATVEAQARRMLFARSWSDRARLLAVAAWLAAHYAETAEQDSVGGLIELIGVVSHG